MSKIIVVTDSNSGISQREAEKIGVRVLPMPFFINDVQHFEDIDLTQDEFYLRLSEGADVSTSQPSPADVIELWENLLKEYDEVVHIPMSSGLSNSCETALMLSKEFDGRVWVVNNQRISVTQRQSVMDALELAEAGKTGKEIKEILEREKLESSIYIMVDTLKYLKKGGRITPAAAMIGTVLNLKPVLQIQGERLDAYAKVRGQKQAKKTMLDAMKKDFDTRFKEAAEKKEMHLAVAHTANEGEARIFAREIAETFPGMGEIVVNDLSLSVACHIGPGSLAIACSKKISYERE
ncbi:MAG: DegV family protein [Ruminococcus sp.]|jgi:DegV family protein with EDD domain